MVPSSGTDSEHGRKAVAIDRRGAMGVDSSASASAKGSLASARDPHAASAVRNAASASDPDATIAVRGGSGRGGLCASALYHGIITAAFANDIDFIVMIMDSHARQLLTSLGMQEVDLVRVYRTFNADAEPFRSASEARD